MKRCVSRVFLFICILTSLAAQSLQELEKKVSEFTLTNGLHFIVFERHQSPVVSFHTYVAAGAVNDPGGETGLAHMFEHMAFKGTETIGTKNFAEEKKALAEVERIYDKLTAERSKGFRMDPLKVRALEKELRAAIEKANSFVKQNEYPRIFEENGAVGLNAMTGEDATQYMVSLPANRIELWFLLESQRFLQPVFREFYKERDVVREERRMRVESNPQGKLFEMLLATAFAAHPYRNMPGGWASDIENLRVGDAQKFFKKYYVPVNMAIGISGDVNPQEIRRLAEKYFSLLPSSPAPEGVRTVEPNQDGPKQAIVEFSSQPFVTIAYKRPDQLDKDDPVFDVLRGLLSSGRTGLLYKELVRDKKIALAAMADAATPGTRFPGLFVLFLVPSLGHTVEENEAACYGILERLKREKVDAESLRRVKTKIRASVTRSLDSNPGIAAQLTYFYMNYGDWRKMITGLDDIDKVTADDVQRVATKYFIEKNRTVVRLMTPQNQPLEAGK
jgi:predicted Zn-dependent peptidase